MMVWAAVAIALMFALALVAAHQPVTIRSVQALSLLGLVCMAFSACAGRALSWASVVDEERLVEASGQVPRPVRLVRRRRRVRRRRLGGGGGRRSTRSSTGYASTSRR